MAKTERTTARHITPHSIAQLDGAEWFQVYRILFHHTRAAITRTVVDEAIEVVKADRERRDLLCHGGEIWTL